jgi:hypothetical protein
VIKIFFSLLNKIVLIFESKQMENFTGVEKLMHDIFTLRKYNTLVRPVDKKNNLTNILTELKLLQIDLVISFKFLNFHF